jgi:hypothetical protein
LKRFRAVLLCSKHRGRADGARVSYDVDGRGLVEPGPTGPTRSRSFVGCYDFGFDVQLPRGIKPGMPVFATELSLCRVSMRLIASIASWGRTLMSKFSCA